MVSLNVFAGPTMNASGLSVNVTLHKSLSYPDIDQLLKSINCSVYFNNFLNPREVIILSCLNSWYEETALKWNSLIPLADI